MANRGYKPEAQMMWTLVLGYIIMTVSGALAKIQQWEISQLLLTAGLLLYLTTLVVLLQDMAVQKLNYKPVWMMSLFTLPVIAPIVYLWRRDKLLRYG